MNADRKQVDYVAIVQILHCSCLALSYRLSTLQVAQCHPLSGSEDRNS